MKTTRFHYDGYSGYRCSKPGDRDGEYVPAAIADRLLSALKAFVDYYDQAGIGECSEADEDDRDDGFDGDEVFNVRQGREAIAEAESNA